MRLIIDSGSTKMDWMILEGGNVTRRFITQGFNPNYSDLRELEGMLAESALPSQLDEIHYYGTGCGSEKNCQLIKVLFQTRFPEAEITVTHDLMAACHALMGHEKGIVCILGTGSNSCVYDGNAITERAVSLGYLVGDEGSGMHIGREVAKIYFYGFMPEDLREEFDKSFHLALEGFIQNLYHSGQPSKYLATFAKFAGEHQTHPYIRELVKGCFKAFIESSVIRYSGCRTMKVSFMGSVAYHFKDILNETIKSYGLMQGEVMASPAQGLVRYYSE